MTSHARLGALLVVLCLLAIGLTAMPTAAGDGVSVITITPEEPTAEPGETLELELRLDSHGAPGAGVEEVVLDIEYDSEYVTVIDVESAGWFEQDGEDLDIETTYDIDDEAGVVRFTETRTPGGDGTTGAAPLATLTIAVDDDAPTNKTADFNAAGGDSAIWLSNGFAQRAASRIGTLTVAESTPTATDRLASPVVGGSALVGTLLVTLLLLSRRR